MEERLTICYIAWLMFNENDNYDELLSQISERGFNCIRIEDGAGLLWDKNGNVREDVTISAPFGKYTKYTTYRTIVENKKLNLLERLLRICKAAKKYNIKVILSSWFFLHTNWFCEEKDKAPIFAMSVEEKISFFAEELNRILVVLRNENLIDTVAFAEIFNEFDGLPFAGEYRGLSAEEADRLRILHEKEIDKLKKCHNDVLFAFDTYKPDVQKELIPRNIDVLNFHLYYAWSAYHAFEKKIVQWSLEEPDIPEETKYYLKDDIISVKEIAKEMKNLRTGLEWPRRISLYLSIDKNKEAELVELLNNELKNNREKYRKKLYDGIEKIISIHDEVVPDSKIVMGEGTTYCASPTLAFERDSEQFWEMVKEQMLYLNKKNIWGSVVSTTHAPERIAAWEPCKDLYLEVNSLFVNGK